MSFEENQKKSQLIGALREGVAVIQMVFFKELRQLISKNYSTMEKSAQAMLTGAITNELFGTPNPEPRFVQFREENRATIMKEIYELSSNFGHLRRYLTDALRIQTLCDSQEGNEDTKVLANADSWGILLKNRDIPLPSVFMTLVRGLGEKHQLIVPPVPITPEDDQRLVH